MKTSSQGPAFTTEAGGQTQFLVQLQSAPLSNVLVTIDASAPDEATVEPSTVSFSPQSWSEPLVVTVTGVDDGDVDGDRQFQLHFTVTSADESYDGLSVPSLPFVNFDDEPLVVSRGLDGAPANGDSEWPSLSSDARYIAFHSKADNLVPGDAFDTYDVFVFDRVTESRSV